MIPICMGPHVVNSQSREESDNKEPPIMEQILIQPKIESPSASFESSLKEPGSIESSFNASLPVESEANIDPELDLSLSKCSTPSSSLSQSTFASFFSLLRNLICECPDSKITLVKVSFVIEITIA